MCRLEVKISALTKEQKHESRSHQGRSGSVDGVGFWKRWCGESRGATNSDAAPKLPDKVWRLCRALRSWRDFHAAGPGLAGVERQLEEQRQRSRIAYVRRAWWLRWAGALSVSD